MAEDENSLDAFVTPEKSAPKNPETINLEDEFTKLLNNFINQDKNNDKQENKSELDSNTTSSPQPVEEQRLDSFVTTTSDKTAAPESLDNFITPQTAPNNAPNNSGEINNVVNEPQPKAENKNGLKKEEFELARAISNFQESIYALSDKKNFKTPVTDYKEEMLLPNYKPSVGKIIAKYLLSCWDIINKYDPENMKRLSKNANDEEYLAFAETLSDTDMQLSIFSYVEILNYLESCENNYEQKKEIIRKNRIKKELYEEYMELQRRKEIFIHKVKEKNFPINVDRLMNNYFKIAQKDPDGSFEALTKNPAMFSPIEFEKIHPKFFGLIKVTPEDGIKANQKIGRFIKKLKV